MRFFLQYSSFLTYSHWSKKKNIIRLVIIDGISKVMSNLPQLLPVKIRLTFPSDGIVTG